MPFRERVKKALGRTHSHSDSKSSPGSEPTDETPKPKYRSPYNKDHQDKLSAFSFSGGLEQLRRKSATSQYSPMGSRMPSRAGSRADTRASRSQGLAGQQQRQGEAVGEVEGDDDVGNVGLSRQHTHTQSQQQQQQQQQQQETQNPPLQTTYPLTNGSQPHDRPFTEDELTLALTKSTLRPKKTSEMVE